MSNSEFLNTCGYLCRKDHGSCWLSQRRAGEQRVATKYVHIGQCPIVATREALHNWPEMLRRAMEAEKKGLDQSLDFD